MATRNLKQLAWNLQRFQRNLTTTPLWRTHTTTIENSEVEHHSQLASQWWDTNGPLRALHALNELRVPFVRDGLISQNRINKDLVGTTNVLQNFNILDVGCGGGILTERLARLGAKVTGIDMSEALISIARDHIHENTLLAQKITYKQESIEEHAKQHIDHYDAVMLSEVLEHIDDKPTFLTNCLLALQPGGSIFITTLNKTLAMWVGGVLLGEYVLKLAPEGTHHWDKMITPLELQRILDALNCHTVLVNGTTYDFWRNSWRWINTTKMCYAMQAIKC